MKITYARQGGHRPPRDDERLEIEAGRFTMWRTVGSATYPPTPIGSFSGDLPEERWNALREMVAAVEEAEHLERRITPDSPVETIRAGDVRGRLGIHDEPEGAWGALVAELRTLLGELTAHPGAALALSVSADGRGATLERRGEGALYVDLTWGTVRAVLWEDEWQNKGSWSDAIEAGTVQETDAGWRFDVPFDHGFEPDENQQVVAYVTLKLRREGSDVPASLESTRK